VIKFAAGVIAGIFAFAIAVWVKAARTLYSTKPTQEEEQQ
jgi:hypothetical protein